MVGWDDSGFRYLVRAGALALAQALPLAMPATTADAQQVQALTSAESVRLGLERNARVRATRAEAAEAEAVYRQVRATRLPSITGAASYTRLIGDIPEVEFTLPGIDTSFTVLPIELNRYHSEISVQQPLFTGQRLHNEVRAAAHQADAAMLRAAQEEAQVAFEIRRAYWTLYQATAVREALGAALAQVDEHLRDVRNRLAVGAALTSDLLTAQTRRSEVLLERVEADNAVRVAQLELNRLIGLPLETAIEPVAQVAVEAVGAVPERVEREVEESPGIRALHEQVRALIAQLRATEGTRFPELGFVGRYVYARPNPYFFADQDRFRGVLEVGLSAQWDIWRGGRRPAEAAAATARLRAAEARLADARDEAAVELMRQYLEVRRSTEAVDVAALNVEQAEEAFRVLRQQFDEGVALSAQVLDAEQALRAAHARSARALADYAIARAAVLYAVGRVW